MLCHVIASVNAFMKVCDSIRLNDSAPFMVKQETPYLSSDVCGATNDRSSQPLLGFVLPYAPATLKAMDIHKYIYYICIYVYIYIKSSRNIQRNLSQE